MSRTKAPAKPLAKPPAKAQAKAQAKIGAARTPGKQPRTMPRTMPGVVPGTEPDVEIDVEALAAGGEGVGRDASGRVTFVAYSAPGDRVRARVTEEKRDYARAEATELVVSSGLRVAPLCPLFINRVCGGCQWQHVGSEAQAAAKEEIVARVLRRHVAAGLNILPLVAAAPAYRWRRRARLHWFRKRKASGAVIGFFAPRSHHVVDIAPCVQLEPALFQAYQALSRTLAPALGRQGEIAMLAGHAGEVHVAIEGTCDPAAAEALVGQAGIVGVTLHSGVPGRQTRQHWGARHIALEPDFPGHADWFAQPSAAGNQALIEAVDEATRPRRGKRILELHAGTGNLTRVLARGAAELMAVDRKAPPWPLPENLSQAFVWGDVVEVAGKLAAEGRRFDMAVLDPPRTGALELIEPLVALAPERIVYVSCDVATLARDMDRLAEAGYRARTAQPLDLMPQTAHVEVVALLERQPAADEVPEPG